MRSRQLLPEADAVPPLVDTVYPPYEAEAPPPPALLVATPPLPAVDAEAPDPLAEDAETPSEPDEDAEDDPPPAEDDEVLPPPLEEADAPELPALLELVVPPPEDEADAEPPPALDDTLVGLVGVGPGTGPTRPPLPPPCAATTVAMGVHTTPGGRIHLSSGITTPCASAQQKTFTCFGVSETQPASKNGSVTTKAIGATGLLDRSDI